MSEFEKTIESQLKELFPNAKIKKQYHISYQGRDLFFDFYLPHINLLIECQGVQHYEFNSFFHSDNKAFKDYQLRDKLKQEWAIAHERVLLELKYDSIPDNANNLFWYISKSIGDYGSKTN